MRWRAASTVAVLAGLMAVPVASAAPPWSAPIAVGPTTQCAPAVDFGSAGAGLVSWVTSCVSGRRATRLASPAGAVVATVPGTAAAPPSVYARGRTALVRARLLTPATDFKHDSRTRVTVAFGRVDGTIGRQKVIATIRNLEHLAFAESPRGDLAVGWVEFRCTRDAQGNCLTSRRLLRVSVRPAGGQFRAPVTLASDRRTDSTELSPGDPALAFGPQGDLAVAFSGRGATAPRTLQVRVRVRRAGHGFGPALVAGPRQASTHIAVAVGADRAVHVVWGTQDGGEQADRPFVVRAARRAPGATRFAASQVLDPGAGIARTPGRIVVGVAPDGTATAAWTQVVGTPVSSMPVRVASTGPTGAFGAATDLAQLGAVQDLAIGADGSATLVWGRIVLADPDQSLQVMAAVRLAGDAAFGPVEGVSAEDQPSIADAAYDPATGKVAVVWTARGAVTGFPQPGVRISQRQVGPVAGATASLARTRHHQRLCHGH